MHKCKLHTQLLWKTCNEVFQKKFIWCMLTCSDDLNVLKKASLKGTHALDSFVKTGLVAVRANSAYMGFKPRGKVGCYSRGGSVLPANAASLLHAHVPAVTGVHNFPQQNPRV